MRYLFLYTILLFLLACHTNTENTLPHPEKVPDDAFFRQRAYPTGQINYKAQLDAAKLYVQETSEKAGAAIWEVDGPYEIAGRINTIAVSKVDDLERIYIGCPSGGIFRSEDEGASWTSLFDEQPTIGIGTIIIDPSDPATVYAGTGDPNGSGTSGAFQGSGIYRSTDYGDTWENIGLENTGSIGKIAVQHDDPDKIFVAAQGPLYGDSDDRGIYRSSDGGANWENVLQLGPTSGALNVIIHPTNPDIVYAAIWQRYRRPYARVYFGPNTGVYKSTDGGDNWTKMNNGFPNMELNRLGLAISPSDPDILYASLTDPGNDFFGIYRSTDGAENWTEANSQDIAPAGFDWYFGDMVVHPTDPYKAYRLGFQVRYLDGQNANTWETRFAETHVDQHAMWIDPENPDRILTGNDGGLAISTNGGLTATHFRNLPITQIYAMEVNEDTPSTRYIGTQDNGTNRVSNPGVNNWTRILGGDGFRTVIDSEDDQLVYTEYQYGNLFRSYSGGDNPVFIKPAINDDRFNWNTPIVTHPNQANYIYIGGQSVMRSTNAGIAWQQYSPSLIGPDPEEGGLTYNTVYDIAPSPASNDYCWAGMDNGRVWITKNDGDSWEDVSADLPNRWVTSIFAHPTLPETAYLTLSGYRWDENTAHIYRTDDGGQNWVSLEGDLPDIPCNEILRDDTDGTLYLATDLGVYISRNEGENWSVLGTGMPAVVVNDLRLHQDTRQLFAATYGRSTWKIDLTEALSTQDNTLATEGLLAYPNPAQDLVNINFDLSSSERVSGQVVDVNGRIVQRISEQPFNAGQQRLSLDFSGLPGGWYVVRLMNTQGRSSTVRVRKR